MSEKLSLTIEGMGSRGEGVGKIDGYTLFVDGALPGEVVEVEVIERKTRYGRGKLLAVISASPDRVEAPCPYFGTCGGCQIMHLAYRKQLEIKRQKVADALVRIGKLDNAPVAACVASPKQFAYRNKIQMPVRQGAGSLRIGLFAAGSNDLVDIDHCMIHNDLGESVYAAVAKLIRDAAIEGYDPRSGTGELRHLLIKSARTTDSALVVFITRKAAKSTLSDLASKIVAEVPAVKGVINVINDRDDNVILGERSMLLAGEASIEEKLCGLSFRISAHSFFQVNPSQAEQLYQKVLDAVGSCEGKIVIDAYCGVGTLALIFARAGAKRVIGIECIKEAIADASANAQRNGIETADFINGEAERVIPSLEKADILLLNPPRKGCDPSLIASIGSTPPKTIVYISCDPATLARDLALLVTGGYTIEVVQPFDMFPQTSHVETMVLLTRA